MVGTPGNECPVGTMPESAEKEDDKGVTDDFCLGAAAATKWDINIVAKPGGE